MAEQSKGALKRRRSKVVDYRNVFNSSQGKRVLYDLMLNHNFLQTSFNKGDDANEMAFKEGGRHVVTRILTILKVDPKQLEQLIEEADRHANQESF